MPKHPYTPTETDRATGARVRQLRKLAGETLMQTIERSGISVGQSTMSRIELGERPLSLPEATKLAAHFNTTVDRIIIQPPVTEQAWLGNEQQAPEPTPLFPLQPAVPEYVPTNTLTIDLHNPLKPEEYREQVWIPYLEARFAQAYPHHLKAS